jgi:hypothetical protein
MAAKRAFKGETISIAHEPRRRPSEYLQERKDTVRIGHGVVTPQRQRVFTPNPLRIP